MARHVYVVGREHRDLYEVLTKQFASDGNVRVVLDRRVGERRRVQADDAPFETERRQRSDRRIRPSVDEELKSRSHAIVSLPDC